MSHLVSLLGRIGLGLSVALFGVLTSSFGFARDFYPIHGVVPDSLGQRAVWVTRKWQPSKKVFEYELILADLETGKNRSLGKVPFTLGQRVFWAPDEQTVLYVENHQGTAILQQKSVNTSKVVALAKFSGKKVSAFTLDSRGERFALVFTREGRSKTLGSVSEPTDSPKQELLVWNRKTKETTEVQSTAFPDRKAVSFGQVAWISGAEPRLAVVIRNGESYRDQFEAAVYELDLRSLRARLISGRGQDISELVVSPDGGQIAYTVGIRPLLDPFSVFQLSQIEVYNRQSKTRKRLNQTEEGQPELKGFSPNGDALLFTEAQHGKFALHRMDLKTQEIRTWDAAQKSSEFFVRLGHRGEWVGLVSESAACSPRPLLLRANLLEKKELNYPSRCEAGIEDLDITWKGRDGLTVHGIVNRPVSGVKGPLLVIPHGGPTFFSFYQYLGTTYHHGVPIDIQAFLRAGYTVFRPNIRGSVSYGSQYREANWKDLGGQDWQDVETGIEELVNRGWVEKNHYAIAGWSYGGFLCGYGATKTSLFRAAACGAAISDWISHDHTSQFSFYVPWYFGRNPEDLASLYPLLVKRSPALSEAKTGAPLLVIHGKEDHAVDFGQGQALYRWAERRAIPTKLLAYPGEGHGFERLDHIDEASEEVTRWITEHMKN
jgi:dienelactone hydrolase